MGQVIPVALHAVFRVQQRAERCAPAALEATFEFPARAVPSVHARLGLDRVPHANAWSRRITMFLPGRAATPPLPSRTRGFGNEIPQADPATRTMPWPRLPVV